MKTNLKYLLSPGMGASIAACLAAATLVVGFLMTSSQPRQVAGLAFVGDEPPAGAPGRSSAAEPFFTVYLVRATNEPELEPAGMRPVLPVMKERLNRTLEWSDYLVAGARDLSRGDDGTAETVLSTDLKFRVSELGGNGFRLQLIADGAPVADYAGRIETGGSVALGGDGGEAAAWLVIVTRTGR